VHGFNRVLVSPGCSFWGYCSCFSRRSGSCPEKGARATENELFLSVWRPLIAWLRELRERWRDRKLYRYFHCPECSQTVRVPKRKGKIRISCPRCGNAFVKKT
jgi:uncharacterized C2H2 Zn-finger protein